MAAFTRTNIQAPTSFDWFQVMTLPANVTNQSASGVVYENIDGTFTLIAGSGLTYDSSGHLTGGTITTMWHYTGTYNATTDTFTTGDELASLTGLSVSASAFMGVLTPSPQNGFAPANLLMAGVDTILHQDLFGDPVDTYNRSQVWLGPGNDTAIGYGDNVLFHMVGGDDVLDGAGVGSLGRTNRWVSYEFDETGLLYVAPDNFGALYDLIIDLNPISAGVQPDRWWLSEGTAVGREENDTLEAIQHVIGSHGDDSIRGIIIDDGTGGTSGTFNPASRSGSIVYARSGDDRISNAQFAYGEGGDDRLFHMSGGTAVATLINFLQGSLLNGGADNDSFHLNALTSNTNQTLHTIIGGAGVDTVVIDYAGIPGNPEGSLQPVIDLENILPSRIFGDHYFFSDLIENVIGNAAQDFISGNSLDNVIEGRGANDTLFGLVGNDTIYGGQGNDTIWGLYGASSNVFGPAPDDDTLYGEDGEDTILGDLGNDEIHGGNHNDHLEGGVGNDRIFGDAGDDTLRGDEDDDLLTGGAGADDLDGGDGFDVASYASSAAGVSAWVLTTGSGGDAQGDTYTSIEGLIGSAFADSLTGDNEANTLDGGDGADSILGLGGDDILIGGAGADSLTGGAGFDTASYITAPSGVVLVLSTGGSVGDAAGDTFSSIFNVIGSDFADIVTGDENANSLWGEDGGDDLEGVGGNDVLIGGAGGDFLDGGADEDFLQGGAGLDTILGGDGFDSWSAMDATQGATVYLYLANGQVLNDGFGNAEDTFGIEALFGSSFGDIFVGTNGVDYLAGLDGGDVLFGLFGADTILGGADGDYIDGGDDGDFIDGGDGFDTILGGEGSDTWSAASGNQGAVVYLYLDGYQAFNDGFGTADALTGIENLYGSVSPDILIGDDQANSLTGLDGGDTLMGRGGNDFITGGLGSDYLEGGDGFDYFAFTAADFAPGDWDVIGAFSVGGNSADFLYMTGLQRGDLTIFDYLGDTYILDGGLGSVGGIYIAGVTAAEVEAQLLFA